MTFEHMVVGGHMYFMPFQADIDKQKQPEQPWKEHQKKKDNVEVGGSRAQFSLSPAGTPSQSSE